MNKPPRKRNKATSASSSDDTPPDNQDLEENPATATITVSAVEVTELTQEEQSDKPDGMATLTACTWRGKWNGHFLKRGKR
ncbi:hypothetical protein [Nostoc sp. FACHB-892]|uniref:hypothetical protein n=1 Tax=Nostoc sp. FACHB-892 TaxID=2692843 RepID=UPI0032200E7E